MPLPERPTDNGESPFHGGAMVYSVRNRASGGWPVQIAPCSLLLQGQDQRPYTRKNRKLPPQSSQEGNTQGRSPNRLHLPWADTRTKSPQSGIHSSKRRLCPPPAIG